MKGKCDMMDKKVLTKTDMIKFIIDLYMDALTEKELAQFENDLMRQDDTSVVETYIKNGGK